jgi:hypothetical protein
MNLYFDESGDFALPADRYDVYVQPANLIRPQTGVQLSAPGQPRSRFRRAIPAGAGVRLRTLRAPARVAVKPSRSNVGEEADEIRADTSVPGRFAASG